MGHCKFAIRPFVVRQASSVRLHFVSAEGGPLPKCYTYRHFATTIESAHHHLASLLKRV